MLENLPRFVFFTGKGGVGKTSLACATALMLTDVGKRVLLVSTDPASNVGQVFETAIGNRITAIPGAAGLDALEIDPEAAAAQYRERIVGPMRGTLPEKVLRSIEEQLSGGCTTEIAAFDEFTGLLTDEALGQRYDHIVFDTAPTGHTLRLLKLPGAWSAFLGEGKGDASCLGPLAGLEKQRTRYAQAVERLADGSSTRLILGHTLLLLDAAGAYHRDILRHAGENAARLVTPLMRLQDPEQTRILIVTLPEPTPVLEATKLQEDLKRAGIQPWGWIVNASLAAPRTHDPLLQRRAQDEVGQIERVRTGLAQRFAVVPMQAEEPVGAARLRGLVQAADCGPRGRVRQGVSA